MLDSRALHTGAIAEIWREFQADDRKAAAEHMAEHEEAKIAKGIKLAGSRANKVNNAMEVDLITTKARLMAELKAHGKFKKTKIEFLKKQVTGRVNRKRKHPRIPIQLKTTNGKQIKVTPPKGEEVKYLQELTLLMMKEDRAAGIAEDEGGDDVQHVDFLRSLPPISVENSFDTCATLRSELDKKVRGKVEAVDDPTLVQCLEPCKGKLLLDEDTQGTYKVVDVNIAGWAKQTRWSLSATCVPMELKSGH